MNGNITKDGISKDLHWMHDAGIVGFHNFDAGLETPQIVEDRLVYMTPGWKDAFRYALDVADSLDMEVTIASSPGWSETGGPWVSDEDAMKKLVWRQVDVVSDGREQIVRLPEGFRCPGNIQDDGNVEWETTSGGYYRDIAVVAVKLPASDVDYAECNPVITASDGTAIAYDRINRDSISDPVVIHGDKDGRAWVQYQFDEPGTVRSIVVTIRKDGQFRYTDDLDLLVSDDGEHFTHAVTCGYQCTSRKVFSFDPLTARYFRLEMRDRSRKAGCEYGLSQFSLSSTTMIHNAGDKAGYGMYRLIYLEDTPSDTAVARLDDVVDLTPCSNDGCCRVSLKPGRWRVYRFGASLTGKTNHPASPEATGLEVDKLDADAVTRYLENYLGTYDDASGGRLGPDGISYMLTDSYEAGPQTWTDNMPGEFRRRKGYDLIQWLPALTGMALGSTDQTERFLFDWRRCIGEMMAENHYDIQNKVLAKYGMKRYTESHENFRANLSDGMDCKRYADVPMSAFWMGWKRGEIFTPRYEADIRESASVAHIYGQNIAAAESFTSNGFRDGAWVFTPAVLKPVADAAMASGLNRFVVHCSPHQPVDDKVPGLGLEIYGQWFDRHETWAGQAKAWTDYLARTCELLQQGRFVSDIAVYYGEDNNITGVYLKEGPDVPSGYNYDYFNPTVLLERARAVDGRIAAGSGTLYSALHLGRNVRYVSMPVLRKIKELADAGVPVYGHEPIALAGLGGTVGEFDALVKDIWHSGRPNVVVGGISSGQLRACGLREDFLAPGAMDKLRFVHRELPDGCQIYWVTNLSDSTLTFDASFRVTGLEPELWNAEDASTSRLSYTIGEEATTVPMTLTPYKSVFIVFRDKAASSSVTLPCTTEKEILTVSAPWKLSFQENRGAPAGLTMDTLEDLSTTPDPGVKYFSGEVTYTNDIILSRKELRQGGRHILDLGDVYDLAEVSVNGTVVGTVWHKPYRIDVTGFLKAGRNNVSIKVVNAWYNRFVGDMQPGVEHRVTYYPVDLLKADDALLPSGLVGPVRLMNVSSN